MANTKHVELIERGSEAWNAWARKNPPAARHLDWADLSAADLRKANLEGVDLSQANLERADLSGATLNGADLTVANLRGANLTVANLRGANLTMANLRWANLGGADLCAADLHCSYLTGANLGAANLSGAHLRKADVVGANLSFANLSDTDMSKAKMGRTIFGGNDLRSTKGLERIAHYGPSTIGVDTLYKSDANIPEAFLRGVGLPEAFITYLPSLIGRPIEFYSCFISYSHADKSFARRLHDSLQGRGIRCWLDEHEMLPGEKIYTEVDRGIRLWDKVLLCCSKDALTSWWVDNEIKIAFDKEQHLWKERGKEVLALIPLNLDGYLFTGKWQSGLATEVKARVAANFGGWEHENARFEEQFERLVKALRTGSEGKRSPPPPLL